MPYPALSDLDIKTTLCFNIRRTIMLGIKTGKGLYFLKCFTIKGCNAGVKAYPLRGTD